MLRIFGFVLSILTIITSMLYSEGSHFPESLDRKLKELKIPLSQDVLVVSVSDQSMVHFKNKNGVYAFNISTALNGYGQEVMSYQTPLGLHKVSNKIGDGAEINTIFKARINTGRKWDSSNPGQYNEHLVLSRILWLEGIEHGLNRGRDTSGVLVDSKKRYIYIHGTNQEDLLGTPASMGCIRMGNRSVMSLFESIPVGTLVWIQK